MNLKHDAIAAAQQGAAVLPCRPQDKRPMVKDWEAAATTDTDVINATWPATAVIGIACGPSKLFVVDLDQPKHDTVRPPGLDPAITSGIDVFTRLCEQHDQPWPHTYTVRTGRGGLHLYFRNPDTGHFRNTAGKRGRGIGWLIDSRGGGGYVIAPPSSIDGRPYTIVRAAPVAELPTWLATLFTPPPAPPRKPVGPPPRVDDAYIAAALKGEIGRVLDATPGGRNDQLNASAFALGQLVATGKLNRTTVETALQRAGEAIGLEVRETWRTVASGLNNGIKNPRRAGGA